MSHIDLNRLVGALEPQLRVALETAASVAVRMGHRHVDIPHWLSAVVDSAAFSNIISELAIDRASLRKEIDRSLSDGVVGDGEDLSLSQHVLSAAREAWLLASLEAGRAEVTLADLFLALDEDDSLRSYVRSAFPSLKMIDRGALERLRRQGGQKPQTDAVAPSLGAGGASSDQNEFLRLYTQDMTQDARSGRIDPVIGRDDELRQMVDILTRRRQNNPILVGEAGVGKTAVAEALALEIVSGNVPEKLKNVRLLTLDLSLLQAGAGVKGEFERRLHGVVDAVKKSADPIILFIDEAHGMIGAGGAAGQGDAANILKPALARGEVRTVAATTWSEYKKYFEKDAALTRRFQPVHVREPDEATAIRMLRGVADTFIKHHDVVVRDDAIVAAVQLSARYMPSRQLPDKAVSLLDTAAAAVSLARQTLPEALRNLDSEKRLLGEELEWLKREPENEETMSRIAALGEALERIERRSAELKSRYDAEMAELNASDDLETQSKDSNVRPLQLVTPVGRNEDRLVPTVVDREVVASVVSRWTGIPLGKLLADQIESARTLDARMKQRVIGQDTAILRIADAMRAARAGLSDPRRPPAVFFLVGMSGTGKTETALALADLLYGGNSHLTTINMSEFKEEHKVSLLLGSPPGYVGYGEGGVLTEAVRRRPFGVLLLDEIDKAHPGVQDIFYQVFDKGILRDGEGRDIDFKNTTIFMTANTGSELLSALSADPETMPEGEALEALLMPELTKQFKPAFLGRTIILPFRPLGAEQLAKIVDIQIGKIGERVKATYGAELTLSDGARAALVERAGSSDIGARAIEIMIGRDLLPPLSSFFLERVIAGDKVASVTVGFDENRFDVRVEAAGETDEFSSAREAGANEVVAPKRKTSRVRRQVER